MTDYHLFDNPTGRYEADDLNDVSLGTEFYVTAQCWLTQFRWYRPLNEMEGSTRQAALYLALDGSRVIEPINLPYPAQGQWGAVDLPAPYELTPGTRYKVVIRHPNGRYPAQLNWFTGSNEVRGPITLPNKDDATNNWQGSYGYSSGMTYPNGEFQAASYFSDVTITDVNPGPGGQTVTPPSIGSAEAFGSVSVSGSLSVSPAGIASGAAFGILIATVPATLAPAAIPSAEAFGSPSVAASLAVSPSGLASAEAFGSPVADVGTFAAPTGIGTAEAFGVPGALLHPRAAPVGIGSTEAFGLPQVVSAVTCVVVGIGSREAFGTPIHRTGVGVLAFRLRDHSAWVPLTGLAKAWSGESWLPARGKRWDGTGWSDL